MFAGLTVADCDVRAAGDRALHRVADVTVAELDAAGAGGSPYARRSRGAGGHRTRQASDKAGGIVLTTLRWWGE